MSYWSLINTCPFLFSPLIHARIHTCGHDERKLNTTGKITFKMHMYSHEKMRAHPVSVLRFYISGLKIR